GHTVLPGFVGLHDHTFYMTAVRSIQSTYTAPRLYLAAGVTTIRTTGAMQPYAEINLKRDIERGLVPGPRMYITGPYITGPGASDNMYQVRGPEDARRAVAYWAEEGASWFKAYTLIRRDELQAVVEEAHRRGLKVTGHLCSVSFREAVALGMDALEHGFFTNTDWHPGKRPDACPADLRGSLRNVDLAAEPVQATIREMVKSKVALTSTLPVYELYVPNRPPLEERVLETMAPEARREYLTSRERIAATAAESPMPEVFRKAQAFELAFFRAGGLLGAGSDPTGIGGALFGFGDQRGYELLIEAGFTPIEAIQVMTSNGAKILGIDDRLGSVVPGQLADLVVIRGDPVKNPAEIRNVVMVFKDGIGYDSAKLIAAVKGQVGVR
ncbi:MAG: amidohydrolase family protein, partial [Gemmatimonadetes bacterium]|nr:amidohydrolase family protein [Gemmatimonadota bacterium]